MKDTMNSKIKINPYVVISMYLCLLPIVILMIFDKILFSEYIKNTSPITLDFVIWFNIVLNFPHIICSFLILCDKKYIIHYKYRLIKFLLAAIGFVAIFIGFWSSFFQEMVTLFALLWTIKHVVGQQFSMTKIFLRVKEDITFKAWKFYGVFIASLVFLGIYSKIYTRYFSYLRDILAIFNDNILLFILPIILLTFILINRALKANNLPGILMLLGNLFMVILSVILYKYEYFSLAALGPRIIHDMSAFYFYGIHSRNKSKASAEAPGFFGMCNRWQPLPLLLSSSVLSVSILWLCLNYFNDLGIYHAMSAVHFFTESFFWKHDSPAREFI